MAKTHRSKPSHTSSTSRGGYSRSRGRSHPVRRSMSPDTALVPTATSSPVQSRVSRASSNETGSSNGTTSRKRFAEEELTETGRKKRRGRHLCRAYECWASPNAILSKGLINMWLSPEALEKLDDPFAIDAVEAIRGVFGVDTPMYRLLVGSDAVEVKDIVRHLKKGQGDARATDTGNIKRWILDWVFPVVNGAAATDRPPHNHKDQRGFKNRTIAKLLAPVQAGPLTDEYLTALHSGTAKVKGSDGVERTVSGKHSRVFAYENGVYDPTNPLKGFLKGELLVEAYKGIFTSPSSTHGDKSCDDARSTKSGNASIMGMTDVTPASIAYITVQVFFALSSNSTFSLSQAPELGEMYEHIRDLFHSNIPYVKWYTKDLLRWWNRRILTVNNKQQDLNTRGVLGELEDFYRTWEVNEVAKGEDEDI